MMQLGKVSFLDGKPMTDVGYRRTRRSFLVGSAAVGALSFLRFGSSSYAEASGINEHSTPPPAAAGDTVIRPFHVHFPDADLTDLRRRIVAARWPEKETVGDVTQGVQLATMQKLAQYWASNYDWRGGGEAERPSTIRHDDRWARHPLHSRSFETCERLADRRHARVAWIDH